jgi:hypothetical protein
MILVFISPAMIKQCQSSPLLFPSTVAPSDSPARTTPLPVHGACIDSCPLFLNWASNPGHDSGSSIAEKSNLDRPSSCRTRAFSRFQALRVRWSTPLGHRFPKIRPLSRVRQAHDLQCHPASKPTSPSRPPYRHLVPPFVLGDILRTV